MYQRLYIIVCVSKLQFIDPEVHMASIQTPAV